MPPAIFTLGALLVPPFAIACGRGLDARSERRAWAQLANSAVASPAAFDERRVADLPAAARRYFCRAIAAGTPLHTVARIEMEGELGLGTREDPRYAPMTARQILALPHGLVWRLRTRQLVGSDGLTPTRSWTRFWLFGLLPVVRAGGPDHRRSAFGRLVAEAAFWTPAALLPGPHVRWEEAGPRLARAIVRHGGLEQAVELELDGDDKPTRVRIQRWSNVNPVKRFQQQPFGGHLSDFREVQGFRVPHAIEGGNHFGTEDYFPFYRARVSVIEFGPG